MANKKTPNKKPAGKEYKVNWALGHDGTNYAEGDSIELGREWAAPLLECGVISNPKAKKAKDDGDGGDEG